ncbi:hypothetical protein J6TS1_36170 [Siminovitchia terrae]|uniref:PucR family transcriptional regulator n=1 Tax=Siminovitchia terrae TaxID=1914933 RepID=A0ABQ4L2G9_SIMTE|nr:PucR family transcriptional regulator [Siminovitchia terrae]GIN97747.1 hypothetical protein J6TS1_36170 [Siminovitchia terrae]
MTSTKTMITVDMALNLPPFGSHEIISGKSGINRKVEWVHIIELATMKTTFNGGELILTTGKGWIDQSELVIPMIHKLIESNASALCIELHTDISNIPEEVTHIADKYKFPIIIFHESVKFMDITRAIYDIMYLKRIDTSSLILNQIWNLESIQETNYKKIVEDKNCGILILVANNVEFITLFKKTSFNIKIIKTYISSFNSTLFLVKTALNIENFQTKIGSILDTAVSKQSDTILVSPYFQNESELVEAIKKLKYLYHYDKYFKLEGIIRFENMHLEKIVYSLYENNTLTSLTDEYLGSLIEYDAKYESELLLTLKVLLETNDNKKEAARKLFISRQTIYHRIDLIKAILNVDFMTPQYKTMYELLLFNIFCRKTTY